MAVRKTRITVDWRCDSVWKTLAVAAFLGAALACALPLVDPGNAVQRTVVDAISDALWTVVAACAVVAAVLYGRKFYALRKANPYARLRLARKLRFDTPRLGRHAAQLAVGEPIIRIRALPKQPRPDRWSPELLRELEWKHFETLCAAYYGHRHFRVESSGCAPDGGSEAKLYFKGLPKPVALLACRAWGSRPVGVKPVRELLAAMTENGIAKGIFHASGEYTTEAKLFAHAHRIQLVSGAQFIAHILKLPDSVQKALFDLTTSGDYTTPVCPSCGEKMVMCTSDHGDYWGCSGYPHCKATLAAVHASW